MAVLIRSHRQYPKLLGNETHVDKFIGFLRDFSNLRPDTGREQRKSETPAARLAREIVLPAQRDTHAYNDSTGSVLIFRDKRSRLFPIN